MKQVVLLVILNSQNYDNSFIYWQILTRSMKEIIVWFLYFEEISSNHTIQGQGLIVGMILSIIYNHNFRRD